MAEKLESTKDVVKAYVDDDGGVRLFFGKKLNEAAKVTNGQHFKLEINGDGSIIFTPLEL